QLLTRTVNTVGEAVLSPPEAPDSLPESLGGQPVVLLHGLTELLPGPSFCLFHSKGRGMLGQPIGLLLHHQVQELQQRQAPQTLLPQLRAAASYIDMENMVHLDLVSNLPRNLVKALPEVELNASLAEGSARHSQQTFAIRLGQPSLSSFLLFQRIQLTTRW
ncbi:hypothetical protein AMECASPLE_010051, partial [Ameca splendens]